MSETPVDRLTPREEEVLALVARGRTNGEIAENLGISLDGAKFHVSQILSRLGADSREEAADYWRAQHGIPMRLRWLAHALWANPGLRWVTVGAAAAAGIAGLWVVVTGSFIGSDDAHIIDVPATRTVEARPDTSIPLWYLPFQLAEESKARYDQVISGIAIGPTVGQPGCEDGSDYQRTDDSTVLDSPVAIEPLWLPVETSVESSGGALCAGTPAFAQVDYRIPPVEADLRKVESGELSFFDARHGGLFTITRTLTSSPAVVIDNLPADRFGAGEIGGIPAVLAPPLFPEGFGHAVVAFYEPDDGILTVVRSDNLNWQDTLKLARGLNP